MAFPQLPRWATGGGASVTEPSEGKKDSGWAVAEKPPAQYFNWLGKKTYDCFNYLAGFVDASDNVQIGPTKNYRYTAPVTRHLIIDPSDYRCIVLSGGTAPVFTKNYPSSTDERTPGYWALSSGDTYFWCAKAALPPGAVITSVHQHIGGKSGTAYMQVMLLAYNAADSAFGLDQTAIDNGSGSTGAAITAASANGWKSIPLVGTVPAVPDDAYVSICGRMTVSGGGGNMSIKGIRVTYTHQNVVPVA